MPSPQSLSDDVDVWSVEGRFQHVIYSPKGTVEGMLIDTNDVLTQFVVDGHDAASAALLGTLRTGQRLVVEGTETAPSPKGDAAHTVYRFERLASVDGREPVSSPASTVSEGRVVRLNYARHGEANGVVLDNGDFVHTRPDGFAALGLRLGDDVLVEGDMHPLADGSGRVVEARLVNGRSIEH